MSTAQPSGKTDFMSMSSLELGKRYKLAEHRIDVLIREQSSLRTNFDMLQAMFYEYDRPTPGIISSMLIAKLGEQIQRRLKELDTELSAMRVELKSLGEATRAKAGWTTRKGH